ncbi:A disintegrin and metalloproteinase with thrombospondin motifs 20 isoform X2 [Hyperolius riggenbachi]|uniref:A disintegrin and metalloproteinase with thrombospondin motifs 20 isoform X2 n=1 Tax=Hyperolius riggenbachi TaxID=752182 RepID=UPI0035A3A101
MLVANWLAGLICHLCVLHTRSLESRLHPKQADFVKTLSSYEIVIPSRINDFGDTFPQTQHFRRRKRDTDVKNSQPHVNRTYYHVAAYGQLFHFNLTINADFIADSYSVVHIGEPVYGFLESSDLEHCFYSGHVNGMEKHPAIMSLCGGMVGTFKAHDGEYFLEPLMNYDSEEHEDEHSKPHLLYKKQQKTGEASEKTGDTSKKTGDASEKADPNCATSESNMKENVVPVQVSSNLGHDITMFTNSALPSSLLQNGTQEANARRTSIRRKRFISYPRYVELMVTADAKMVRHHGRNLQHYVLTLMSIVAAIYKDPSIGNLINILIVKLIIIHSEQEGPVITFNAATTLQNFCVWQRTQNVPDDSHPSHYDTAVLLTREDICRASNKCDTLGLAELGTMCDLHRSCSISEENGLGAAFTIAHELGHVFNMPHDDSSKCKDIGVKNEFHVMSAILSPDTSPWTWSRCSQKYVTEFLDTGYGECLLDKASGRVYEFSHQLPGIIYDANKQCELMFGAGSQVCPYMKQCKRLWCTSTEGMHKGCYTQHMPLADGSDCGHGKHCRSGLCVDKVDARAVDGDWGPWEPYTSCSRICDGGIKTSSRNCNQPEPRNGGRYCVGRRMKFRSCNTDSCPRGKKDFRDVQCSNYDGKHFNINGLTTSVRWIPKYSGILMKDRCKLFCRVSGTSSYYQLKDRVVDGTPCGPETDDLCVQGLCRQAGCDHVLNSKARRDKCGVCGGDNSSCKTVAGTFNNAQYGYNIIIKIPAGATHIDVHQHSYSGRPDDDNYLALSDSQGTFVLNGNYIVSQFKREVNVKGTVVEYSGSDNVVERINCTNRLEEDLILQILCVGNLYNPDVRYTFNIPIEDKSNQFSWDQYGPWQTCNKLCQGVRKRKVTCIRRSDSVVVSDQRCEHLSRPESITEPCNTDCQLGWYVIGKSQCTSQCGPGHRSLDVRCIKYSSVRGLTTPVEDKFCNSHSKPAQQEPCHGDCLSVSWHYSEWSQCSRSCGTGVQTRESYCLNNLGQRLSHQDCNEKHKIVSKSCNEHSCPEWVTSDWSECLVTCGKGTRHRHVTCQLIDEQLKDDYCDPHKKPESITACELQECAYWHVGPWGECSVTCGHGYQLRMVKCSTGTYEPTYECNAASRPIDTQCSASCGRGNRARYVSCRDVLGRVADDSFCAHSLQPSESSDCFTPCGEWQSGDWSPCTVTCGKGKVIRQVVCTSYHGIIDENNCDPDGRPVLEQDCNKAPCQGYNHFPGSHDHPMRFPQPESPHKSREHDIHNTIHQPNKHSRGYQWRTGPWGACSSTCAGGFERRVVVCQDSEGRDSHFCDETIKPVETRHCDSGSCPQWNSRSWGECTKTCGGGMKTRQVACQLTNGQVLNDQNCEILDKPPNVAQCNVHACPAGASWHPRPWKSCSVTCGKGVKHRDVYCMLNGEPVNESHCNHVRKLRVQKTCRMGRCPSWKSKKWSECSVTCGVGIHHRHVYCRMRGRGRIQDAFCNSTARPESQKSCALPECILYLWEAEEWPSCSTDCKEEEVTRKIKCLDVMGKPVNESYCDATAKPTATRKCINAACKNIVVTEDVSQCPRSCWIGYKQKLTYCRRVLSKHNHYVNGLRAVSYKSCPLRQYSVHHKCSGKSCVQTIFWRVGKWSKCSASCGIGIMERKVLCRTESNHASNLCPSRVKPRSRKSCLSKHCDYSSCKELRLINNTHTDGDYTLKLNNRKVKIYCSGMQSDSPKEYITLMKGEADNFSEVFGYRLKNPYECPFNGSRKQDCACKNDYLAAGVTVFSKIRLDIISMQIKTTDLMFARTILGRAVPYATAGDCYSAAKCPQGQFSINLTGTGFRISEATKWIAQGNYATANVHKSQDGTKIYGRCGGYCGKCVPHLAAGLQVQLQER